MISKFCVPIINGRCVWVRRGHSAIVTWSLGLGTWSSPMDLDDEMKGARCVLNCVSKALQVLFVLFCLKFECLQVTSHWWAMWAPLLPLGSSNQDTQSNVIQLWRWQRNALVCFSVRLETGRVVLCHPFRRVLPSSENPDQKLLI